MKTKIGALAISVLMLMVAVPAVSAGPYEEAQEQYREARDAFWDAHSAWIHARDTFVDARAAWRQNRTDPTLIANLREAARNTMLAADNMMIKRLEALKARVEATRGLSDNEKTTYKTEIDGYISWLQARQAEIQAAENGQVLRSIAGTIRGYWASVRVRIKYIVGQILSRWVDAIVQKAEAFAGRIEAKIENLKDQGIDTSALEAWLADYNSKLALAEQKYDAAKAKFSQISSVEDADELFREGVAFIKEGNSYIKDALKALRDIVSDMRNRGHTVTLSGSGTLIAQGNGSAYISGTGGVRVRAPVEGNMLVSPGAEVTTDGQGTVEVLENNWVKYQGFGSATVRGTNMVVDINGNGIDIVARGTGTVRLVGSGSYRTYGENLYVDGTWTEVGVTATLATGATTAG
ncbi:MAG: hypothetical protein QMD00_03355 [Hadesarchaea archaeon]|nr:hypothetical protein [Hadesarchaea archaeon]